MKSQQLLLMGLALLLVSGCQSGPKYGMQFTPTSAVALNNFTALSSQSQSRSELLQPSTENYTVGPGDKLQIEILGDQSTQQTVLVGPDGKIYFYLLPGIDVWGLTLPQVRQKIENSLQNYVRGNAQVGVSLRESGSKHVWLLGRFQSPGEYPLNGPTTLLGAIAEAGGPATASTVTSGSSGPLGPSLSGDIADLHRSFVMRDGHVLPVDFYRLLKMGDMSQDIYLQPDDFIYMPSEMAKEVYVLGAVVDPTSVSYHENVTLVGAIAAAQGTARSAYLSHVAIVRGTLTNPKIAIVDYKAVVKGEAPNVLLQPGDIVYVPYTPYRLLLAYGDMILRTFVQTVAVNEGARAVSRNAGVVGVAINPGGTGGVSGGGGGVIVGGGGGGGGGGNGGGGQ